jgi:hypothetical protein
LPASHLSGKFFSQAGLPEKKNNRTKNVQVARLYLSKPDPADPAEISNYFPEDE